MADAADLLFSEVGPHNSGGSKGNTRPIEPSAIRDNVLVRTHRTFEA